MPGIVDKIERDQRNEGTTGLVFASTDRDNWSAVHGLDLAGMRLSDAVSTPSSLVIVGEADGRALVLRAEAGN